MNNELNTLDEAIEILAGMKAGKSLQVKTHEHWQTRIPHAPELPNFGHYKYRLKPEPLERWVNVFANGGSAIHETKEEAKLFACSAVRIAVHMREVTE